MNRILPFFGLAAILLFVGMGSCAEKSQANKSRSETEKKEVVQPVYGYHPDSFYTVRETVEPNQFLADILLKEDLSYGEIHNLVQHTDSVFDPRNIRSGRSYCFLYSDSCARPDMMIYELSPYAYLEYDLHCLDVERIDRPIETKIKKTGGRIDGSLWLSLDEIGAPTSLISKMEDALAWSVDFYYIQPQDSFFLLYEEQWSEDAFLGTGKLLGAYFASGGQEYYSIWYESDNYHGFFDPEARPMKKHFSNRPSPIPAFRVGIIRDDFILFKKE